MSEQKTIVLSADYSELREYILFNKYTNIMLVCDSFLPNLKIGAFFDAIENEGKIKIVRFDKFEPNPRYESVKSGIELFNSENCDAIIAVGGGSAMDVAKCIKLFAECDSSEPYFNQILKPNNISLSVVPTTAGTGSESTKYAVIYYNGEKQSVTNVNCIPDNVFFDTCVLDTLPMYQRKATMMDALCHAIESFWSINSTEVSRKYSFDAIRSIFYNMKAYLSNDRTANINMLFASNIAGKAINITQTTAGHAMSYKLTSMFGIAHGHAAALCVSQIWPYMLDNIDNCIDVRGKDFLIHVFSDIANAMDCNNAREAANKFSVILSDLELLPPSLIEESQYMVLKESVNPVRLKNNPISFSVDEIDFLYKRILGK